MSLETRFQWFIHSFEQGRISVWIKRFLILATILFVGSFWIFIKFSGFKDIDAMDQAQIGRQIASHQGYSTLYARPFALNRFLLRKGHVPSPLPEINQPPLGPLINAAIFKISRTGFEISDSGISNAERYIAITGFLFFLASIVLTYLLARRLFDSSLAALSCALALLSYIFWLFISSGLPQLPILFFFSFGMLFASIAMDAQNAKRRLKAGVFAVFASFFIGLVALGNPVGVFILAGFWLFLAIVIRPRRFVAPLSAAAGLLPLLPWAFLNWRAIRNPFGLAFYEIYRPAGLDRLEFLSDFEPILNFQLMDFLQNIAANFLAQTTDFFSYFGGNFIAIAFFLSLFFGHFIRWQAAQFRWCVFFMWLGAVVGMSVFGVDGTISVNQLHTIFLPIMGVYGLSFLLSLWSRLQLNQPIFRTSFIILLFLVVSFPFLSALKGLNRSPVWPPYLPPLITHFSNWVNPDEAMAADIPWATAWYANRTSLLLPINIDQFDLIHRERLLDKPLVALYLTPFSSDLPVYSNIINGRYRNWARFVLHDMGQDDLRHWTLRYVIPLPVNGQSIFYADAPRWMKQAR